MVSFTALLAIIEEIKSDTVADISEHLMANGETGSLTTVKRNVTKLLDDNAYKQGDWQDLDDNKTMIKFLLKKKTDELLQLEKKFAYTGEIDPTKVEEKNRYQKPVLENIKMLKSILSGPNGSGKNDPRDPKDPELRETDLAKLLNNAAATAEQKVFDSKKH